MAAKSGNSKKKSPGKRKGNTKETEGLKQEIILLSVLAVSILLFLSNFGIGGFIGNAISSVMFGIFGWIAYIFPILLFGVTAFVFSNKGNTHAYIKSVSVIVLMMMTCTFLALVTKAYGQRSSFFDYYILASKHKNAGGFIGGCLAELFSSLIGVVGTYVLVILVAGITFILITERSLLKLVVPVGKQAYKTARQHGETAVIRAKERRTQRMEVRHSKRNAAEKDTTVFAGESRKKIGAGISFDTTVGEDNHKKKSPEVTELYFNEEEVFFHDESIPQHELFEEGEYKDIDEIKDIKPADNKKSSRPPALTPEEGKAVAEEIQKLQEKPKKVYKVPPLNLLVKGKKAGGDSDAHLRATARKLEETLQNFGVRVRVTNASCGPSVTRYELQPEQGVKVSKIVGLADDIKLNLAVTDLRIEAPIPGKAAVGIEVPNMENTTVMLRDLMESNEFQRSTSNITFAVGRDIAGKVVVADIAKMPHLLVAGSTGSGKSVCINTLIMSIIYKSSPEDVKLIMIDPKVVELNIYNGIPHLMIPVVTDPRKAAGALNWAVAEMTKRYQLFAEYNVRDLKGFNEKISRLTPGEDVPEKLPQIVIIVDELADLMMVAPKDVEGAICRLAQLARAAGLHLILATQRPSVNVITGLIKANMPSRIAFAVSSGVDSRTIIDMNGAEKLLGKGDMLFYPTGYPKPVRVQGSFVSEKEIQKVVDFLIKNYGDISYSAELEEHINQNTNLPEDIAITESSVDDGKDKFFQDAGLLIIDKEKASIGMLQRMFKIGFNRAARIMDQLAQAGVVGPEEGTKPRKVLMTKEEFEAYLHQNR